MRSVRGPTPERGRARPPARPAATATATAARAAGLVEAWAAGSETTIELVERLHGPPDEELLTRLQPAGATLDRVPV